MSFERLFDDWKEITLGDIAIKDGYGLVDGPFGSNLPASKYVASGVPVIRGSNLSLGEQRFKGNDFVFVSEETAKRLERSLCHPLDIIFTKKGTLGQTGIIPESSYFKKYLLSSNQMKLSVDKDVADPLFVYYYVSSNISRKKIIHDSEATGVPKTNLEYLRKFPIMLPPLPVQRAIARILGSLDDKIEANRRMNETLEAMALTLFKSWFVDFDPVRARTEGQAPAGIDAETVALFPDGFEKTELGEIPKGWLVVRLSDICSTQYGYTESASDQPIGPHFLRVTDINKQNWIDWKKVPYCRISDKDFEKYCLRIGDIIVARMADPGKSAIIESNIAAVFASYLVRLKMESLSHSYYVYGFLKSAKYTDYVEGAKSGSVQANMNAKIITDIFLVLPNQTILDKYLEKILPLRLRLISNIRESNILSEIRDSLLIKLISREARVKL